MHVGSTLSRTVKQHVCMVLSLLPHEANVVLGILCLQFNTIGWSGQVTSAISRHHDLGQGWPTSQRTRATFLTVLPQRATPYTWAHTTSPYLILTHTHTYAQLDLL